MKHQVAQQRIYDSLNTRVFGYELLSRWVTDLGVIKRPEYVKHIDWCEIDLQVVACLESAITHQSFKESIYFINVSNELLICEDSFKGWLEVLKRIERSGIKCTVEITEDIPDEVLNNRFKAIRNVASYMAQDDFNYKYSNLARLRKYSWDFCKFNINDLSQADVQIALDYCKNMNIKMISERVEGINQLRSSLSNGLVLQQGFLWHRPEIKVHFKNNEKQKEALV